MKNRFLKMTAADSVATALVNLEAGETAEIYTADNQTVTEIVAIDDIPFGNKIALTDMSKGDKVIKYGAEIGETTRDISKGKLVHVHNIKSLIADIPPCH